MARYRATIQGQRGQASRLGHGASGISASVNGWHGGIDVEVNPCAVPGCDGDYFIARATQGSGYGESPSNARIEFCSNKRHTTFVRKQRAVSRAYDREQEQELPPCVRAMQCYCAGHARGNPINAPCDTSEQAQEQS